MPDPDLEIRGEGGRGGGERRGGEGGEEGERGGRSPKKFFFSPFGPQFGGPSPGSATVKFPVVDHRCHHGEKSISYLLSHLGPVVRRSISA